MATKKSHAPWAALLLVLVALIAVNCSSSDPVDPESASTPDAASNEPETAEEDVESSDTGSEDDEAEPTPVPTAGPTLADDDTASVAELAAGEQVEDSQGNLLAVYGVAEWPASFDELPAASQQAFPFFGDISTLTDAATSLIALDIGMCSAGIDAAGFGTAEFFVHENSAAPLSSDPVLDRAVLARHPVVQPGFDFPTSAECLRGWLPVIWNGAGTPSTARYVLATRSSSTAAVERHVYQWELDAFVDIEPASADTDLFGIGQTVTFNGGRLAGATVVVDGWAELVNNESELEGTRLVGVSLTACPASGQLPEFGLGVDGWNLASPLPQPEAADSCYDGWLEFEVPFGGVPTSFFASDGRDSTIGYAEWSLADAALASP